MREQILAILAEVPPGSAANLKYLLDRLAPNEAQKAKFKIKCQIERELGILKSQGIIEHQSRWRGKYNEPNIYYRLAERVSIPHRSL